MKKCLDCLKEVPDDSEFCQYCGGGKIETIGTKVKVFKRCIDCGKELPEDSDFCQYCGSKRVAKVNDTVKESKTKTISGKIKGIGDNKKFVIILVVAGCLLLGLIYYMNSYYNLLDYSASEINSLEEKINTAEEKTKNIQKQLDNYRTKAGNYDKVISYAKNANRYPDLYCEQTVLYNPRNERVYVYWSGREEIWLTTSSGYVNAEWNKTWNGYVTSFDVTYTGSGVEYVKVYNASQTKSVYVVLVGD